MRFESRVALRYLTSSKLQTGLILSLVALGVMSFTFIAALINGLADLLIEDIIGNLPHVYLEVPSDGPMLLPALMEDGREALVASQRGREPQRAISGWRPLVASLEDEAELTAILPVARGNGLAQRATNVEPIAIIGVPPESLSAIVDVAENLVAGDDRLGPGEVIVGRRLAENLEASVGQRVTLISEEEARRTFTVRGIFDTGGRALDETTVFMDLDAAQSLLDLAGRVTRIELQVADVFQAPAVSRRLAGATGLEATSWIDEAENLEDALRAQASTGELVKAFSLLVVVVGVASALLLAATRRRAEVAIVRSMGFSKSTVMRIFICQGVFIGLAGALIGSAMGWLFGTMLVELTGGPEGPSLPVYPAQGEYLTAVLLAVAACTLAAILPARSAARVDPVQVLAQ